MSEENYLIKEDFSKQEFQDIFDKENGKSRQFVNKPLPTQKKEFNLKERSLKKELFFDNRTHKLLSTREASDFLGVSENALRILVCRKKVRAYKLRLKFKLDDLASCLQKKEV